MKQLPITNAELEARIKRLEKRVIELEAVVEHRTKHLRYRLGA